MLKFTQMELDKCTVLVVDGELDRSTERQFKERVSELADGRNVPVVLDMHNVDFVDSAGLGTLVSLIFEYKRRGKKIKIHRPSHMLEVLMSHCAVS